MKFALNEGVVLYRFSFGSSGYVSARGKPRSVAGERG